MAKVLSVLRLEVFVSYAFSVPSFYVVVYYVALAMMPTPTLVVVVDVLTTMLTRILNAVKELGC